MPAALRDRAPRIERFDEGDAWVIEGVADPINFGMNACAGLEPEDMHGLGALRRHPRAAATTRPPASRRWTATASTPRCCTRRPGSRQAIVANHDAEYHLAMVQAYNDWLSEYVAYAPERFGGLAMLPNRGVERRVAEIDRVLDRPGMRGVVMGCYPNGTLAIEPEDDKVLGGSPSAASRSASTCR